LIGSSRCTDHGNVLLTGASGKEKLVARAIQSAQSQGFQEILIVNCTAIPEQVIESELSAT